MKKAISEDFENLESKMEKTKNTISEEYLIPEKKSEKKQSYEVVKSFVHPLGTFNKGRMLTEDDIDKGFLQRYSNIGYLKKKGKKA